MHKKSFMLGLGLGFFVLSLLFLVVYQNADAVIVEVPRDLTEEEIIELGKEQGMVYLTELPSATALTDNEIIERATAMGMRFASGDITPEQQAAGSDTEVYVRINIVSGTGSPKVVNMLYETGVIDDKEAFSAFLGERQATRIIKTGEVYLPLGADYDTILSLLLN